MIIRLATTTDAPAISTLIQACAHHFLLDASGQGAEGFLDSITAHSIRGYIADARFQYWVVTQGSALAGAAALRDGKHLFHLFVDPAYQRRGLARALWSVVRAHAAADLEAFTVNASPNAVPVYEKFGFAATGPRTEMNGIAFIPMRAFITVPPN